MAEIVRASVSVEYKADEETEDLGPPVVVLNKDTTKAPYGYDYARMYFVGSTPKTFSTSGYSVQTVNRGVVSDELEVLTFDGRDEASFPTPVVSNVSLTPLGRFLSPKGDTLSRVSFTVDAARGTLKANAPFYGTVQAKYNSTFHRLMVQFRAIPGAYEDPTYESEFAPLVLIATSKGETESLSFSPPSKDQKPEDEDKRKPSMSAADKSTGERIVLELDNMFPVSLSHQPMPGMGGLVAVARVAVYSPHGGVSFAVSNGLVRGDNYSIDDTLDLEEAVTFVGAQSASLKYPPANGVSIVKADNITSRQTSNTIFNFVAAPYWVTLADWFAYGAYVITGAREVVSNEIVATASGVAVPVSGTVLAKYSTRRTYVDVFWSRMGNWFAPTVLTASDMWGNTESITISPPERRGR